ncbi:MAG: type I 3-dehydroquinate dehydratase [Phycisphaerae bacterium]
MSNELESGRRADDSEPRIVACLTRADPPLHEQARRAVAGGADIVELRVDLIDNLPEIERFLARPERLPAILTLRRSDEGGAWDGDESQRISLIQRLGLLRPGFIDLEFAAWRASANLRQKIGLVCELEPEGRQGAHGTDEVTGPSDTAGAAADATARAKNRLILSRHDLRETPRDVLDAISELLASPCHIAKAAFATCDARDMMRILDAQRLAARRRAALMATGSAAAASRVLGAKFGASLVYAAADNSGSRAHAAPGQPTMEELVTFGLLRSAARERGADRVARRGRVSRSTQVYGVIGWPVGHSLSPALHNAAMSALDIDGVYVPLPVQATEGALAEFLDAIAGNEWLDVHGLSVTIPHKRAALDWLVARAGRVTPLAKRCGALNTLSRQADGAWRGDNTDVPTDWDAARGRAIDILGAGGVARAIVVAMVDAGCRVTIYARNARRAEQLAAEFGCEWRDWSEREKLRGQVVINCTPVGMWPEVDASPLPASALAPPRLVIDTVYRPAETRLMREARGAGCEVISGMSMFWNQAAGQFRIWHGRELPLSAKEVLQ